jgi:ABC-type sugar transport system substrate-binding protein
MKRKLVITLCALAIGLAGSTGASAQDDGAAMIADVVIARPACFVATVVGSAFFVISLPFALATKKVKGAAEALVVTPARATFTRPLGDLDSLIGN